MTGQTRIVFVCMGNICRSPTAEVVMQSLIDEQGCSDRFELASAGTAGWHAGEPIDRRSGEALRHAGYDPSRHRARQFVVEDFGRFDLVIAMDRKNRWVLDGMAPTPAEQAKIRMLRSFDSRAARSGELDVPDPYYDGGFDTVLGMVEAACRGLLAELTSGPELSRS